MAAATPTRRTLQANAPGRPSGGSHLNLVTAATATTTPTTPPTAAPTKSPGCPAALPRTDPSKAPRPANAQAAMRTGIGLKGIASLWAVVCRLTDRFKLRAGALAALALYCIYEAHWTRTSAASRLVSFKPYLSCYTPRYPLLVADPKEGKDIP